MHGVYVGVITTTTRVHLYLLGSTNMTTREKAQVWPMSSFIEGFGIQRTLDGDAVQNESTSTKFFSTCTHGLRGMTVDIWRWLQESPLGLVLELAVCYFGDM